MSAMADPGLVAALGRFAAGRDALAARPVVVELTAGALNRVYRVTSAAGDWAVRLAGAADAALAINRVAERQIHAVAAELGFAPPIVHAAPGEGVLVTEFDAGAPVSRQRLRQPQLLRELGERLGELHRAEVPRTVRRLDVHDVLLHYLEQPGVPPGPLSRDLIASRLRWSLANYRQTGLALCHNDLHHRNLLAGPRLVFVDWEYGGAGDPLFELAAIIGYHDLDEEQRATLLAGHGGSFRAVDVASMCLVFDCLHALWLDAARAWGGLEDGTRDALLARLAIDPADREE
jgi:thiamine kinase-like enzyme